MSGLTYVCMSSIMVRILIIILIIKFENYHHITRYFLISITARLEKSQL